MAAGQNLDAFLDLKADSSKKERKKRNVYTKIIQLFSEGYYFIQLQSDVFVYIDL